MRMTVITAVLVTAASAWVARPYEAANLADETANKFAVQKREHGLGHNGEPSVIKSKYQPPTPTDPFESYYTQAMVKRMPKGKKDKNAPPEPTTDPDVDVVEVEVLELIYTDAMSKRMPKGKKDKNAPPTPTTDPFESYYTQAMVKRMPEDKKDKTKYTKTETETRIVRLSKIPVTVVTEMTTEPIYTVTNTIVTAQSARKVTATVTNTVVSVQSASKVTATVTNTVVSVESASKVTATVTNTIVSVQSASKVTATVTDTIIVTKSSGSTPASRSTMTVTSTTTAGSSSLPQVASTSVVVPVTTMLPTQTTFSTSTITTKPSAKGGLITLPTQSHTKHRLGDVLMSFLGGGRGRHTATAATSSSSSFYWPVPKPTNTIPIHTKRDDNVAKSLLERDYYTSQTRDQRPPIQASTW